MWLISFFTRLFKKTEVPLTPEQEVELREQLRIMQDLERNSTRDSTGNVPRQLPHGWETGVGGKAIAAHTWRNPKRNP